MNPSSAASSAPSSAAIDPFRQLACDGSVRPYPGAAALAAQLKALHPGGVDSILIGTMSRPGYGITVNSKGIIAILIGLLLPAVQKVRDAAARSPEVIALRSALSPRGNINILMGDGSVRTVVGPQGLAASGDPHGFH